MLNLALSQLNMLSYLLVDFRSVYLCICRVAVMVDWALKTVSHPSAETKKTK